jgi:hypothetical protein
VPSLAAGLVASVAGWMLDGVLEPFLGVSLRLLLSLVFTTAIFLLARRWLRALRGR